MVAMTGWRSSADDGYCVGDDFHASVMLFSGSVEELIANMNPDIPAVSAASDAASLEVATVDTLAGGD